MIWTKLLYGLSNESKKGGNMGRPIFKQQLHLSLRYDFSSKIVFPSKNKKAKKYYRNASSNYSKKARRYIFKRDDYKCVLCEKKEGLEIDHIVAVIFGWNNRMSLEKINNVDNLRTICKSCHSKKVEL